MLLRIGACHDSAKEKLYTTCHDGLSLKPLTRRVVPYRRSTAAESAPFHAVLARSRLITKMHTQKATSNQNTQVTGKGKAKYKETGA
jgi:hypothetical protein